VAPQRIRPWPNGGWPDKGIRMTDMSLQASVTAELAWDPKVGNDDIAVSAEGRVMTDSGTDATLRAVVWALFADSLIPEPRGG
jgi:hypothetical protein